MALQIWCPFTSDTKQQGLGDISIPISASQGSIVTNGKLGKCLKTTATGNIETTYIPDLNNSNYSIGGWFKFNKSELQTALSNLDYTSIKTYAIGNLIGNNSFGGLGLCWNSNDMYASSRVFNRLDIFGCLRTSSAGVQNVGTIIVDFDVWMHIFLVFDRIHKTLSLYKNGSLIQSKTITDFSDGVSRKLYINYGAVTAGNGPGACIPFYMNDFRLYDHALSPKEIEILSRGLVCHYPLNGGGRGGDNLLKNTGDLTLWAKEAGITTTWDSEKNLYKIVDSTHTSNRWGIYQDINIEANTSYTITCTLNGDNCAVAFGFYDSSTSFPGNLITVTDSTTKRLSYTVTSGANSTKARVYLNMNCANSATKTAWFGTPKVEKGSVSTPWIPNSADAAYTAMGYNSTTEYDVSGNGYNGTKNGTISYTSDSARYSVASHFNGSSYISRTSPSESVRSASFWIKTPKTNYTVAWGDYKSKLAFGIVSSGEILTCCGMTSAVIKKYPNSVIAANTWQHIVLVRNDAMTNMDLYVNGVKQTATGAADYWTHQQDTLIISGRDYSTPSRMICDISDFRLYATTLTEAQIKDLYNTAVSVANNGSLLGYELVES